MNNIKEVILEILTIIAIVFAGAVGIIAGIAAILAVVVSLFEPYEYRSCNIYGEMTGLKTEYRWYDECYIQVADKMLPKKEYLARSIQKKQEIEIK